MGLFPAIFSRSGSEWNALLHSQELDSNLKEIIKLFFIPDNISIEKFICNEQAYQTSTNECIEKGTPSCKYACAFKYRTFVAFYLPDWFLITYPDVAEWMDRNPWNLSEYFGARYMEKNSTNRPNISFLRAAIQTYITQGKK